MRKTDTKVPIDILWDLWGKVEAIEILEDLHYGNGLDYVPKGTVLFPQESEHYDAVAIYENIDGTIVTKIRISCTEMIISNHMEIRAKKRRKPITIHLRK